MRLILVLFSLGLQSIQADQVTDFIDVLPFNLNGYQDPAFLVDLDLAVFLGEFRLDARFDISLNFVLVETDAVRRAASSTQVTLRLERKSLGGPVECSASQRARVDCMLQQQGRRMRVFKAINPLYGNVSIQLNYRTLVGPRQLAGREEIRMQFHPRFVHLGDGANTNTNTNDRSDKTENKISKMFLLHAIVFSVLFVVVAPLLAAGTWRAKIGGVTSGSWIVFNVLLVVLWRMQPHAEKEDRVTFENVSVWDKISYNHATIGKAFIFGCIAVSAIVCTAHCLRLRRPDQPKSRIIERAKKTGLVTMLLLGPVVLFTGARRSRTDEEISVFHQPHLFLLSYVLIALLAGLWTYGAVRRIPARLWQWIKTSREKKAVAPAVEMPAELAEFAGAPLVPAKIVGMRMENEWLLRVVLQIQGLWEIGQRVAIGLNTGLTSVYCCAEISKEGEGHFIVRIQPEDQVSLVLRQLGMGYLLGARVGTEILRLPEGTSSVTILAEGAGIATALVLIKGRTGECPVSLFWLLSERQDLCLVEELCALARQDPLVDITVVFSQQSQDTAGDSGVPQIKFATGRISQDQIVESALSQSQRLLIIGVAQFVRDATAFAMHQAQFPPTNLYALLT